MKVSFRIRTKPEHAEADITRVTAIIKAFNGLVDPKTNKPPEIIIEDDFIEVKGSPQVKDSALSLLRAADIPTRIP